MDTINERIRIVFLQTGLTQAAFAKALDLSGPMVSMLLAGKSGVSDRTILSICRCFGISEQWLRTGEGDMTAASADPIRAAFDAALVGNNAKSRVLRALAQIPEAEFSALLRIAKSIADAPEQ